VDLRAHDIVWLNQDAEVSPRHLPAWASESLGRTRAVVVRRALAGAGWLPVGVRGTARHQRHACFVRCRDIKSHCTPEWLSSPENWRRHACTLKTFPAWKALEAVSSCAARNHLIWGPVGSVGYQLATGVAAVSGTSDLDILLRLSARTDRNSLEKFYEVISLSDVSVDVILEGQSGAVNLAEYLRCPDRLLIKTNAGPHVGSFSW
jgi:phosphoribosyl-dephospho-CoA transferase